MVLDILYIDFLVLLDYHTVSGKKMSVDIARARGFVRQKELERKEKLKKKLNQAKADFKKITCMIIDKYNPAKVYQWGSLLNEAHFSEISDIDIALEGLKSAEEFFQIYGEAMRMTDFSLDIVEVDKIEPEFRENIISGGRLIYDRK